jgi:hypothetical protein
LAIVGGIVTPSALFGQIAALAPRDVPARSIPVPTDVSPQMRNIIALPLRQGWNVLPKTGDEWKAAADAGAAATAKLLPGMRERLPVKVESAP